MKIEYKKNTILITEDEKVLKLKEITKDNIPLVKQKCILKFKNSKLGHYFWIPKTLTMNTLEELIRYFLDNMETNYLKVYIYIVKKNS